MFPWGKFPFSKDMMKSMKPEMIEQYVMDAISQYMPQGSETGPIIPMQQEARQPEASSKIQAMIFETHEFVFVRIPLKNDWLEKIRIFHTANQLMVENIPESGDKETFILPAPVRKKGATAAFIDGILEIKFQKLTSSHLSEIHIGPSS
ncbi:hypothetical protein AM500_10830 [Bacillus sp. FJAT-18017]|uniref:Hsp20/alpha crystallin family protein n=1 Tax=Bacillus sp. FJAT-18017 TaxID=1705566 RepID=UPI0006AF68A4|nr:Hsp20/alpha crystallin family protein [Bacillus sp. FJAT-18017]ALC90221.1 hypothetical protein AM500_10830 [Bacillus sp. FJAT-18017]